MDIILLPGLWLDGSSWDAVAGLIGSSGHRPLSVTFPGMTPGEDIAQVSLQDHVDAVVAAIDTAGPDRVALVAHSAAGGVAHAAADARPDRIARVIYVGGFPTPDGLPVAGGFEVVDGGIPLPGWEEFDDADMSDLDDSARATFRANSIASPARLTIDAQRLSNPNRLAVPVTMVCTEYTSEELQSWVEQDLEPVSELTDLAHVEYVDLPTGHWPQITRPAELAAIIIERACEPRIDEVGRIEVPVAVGETLTLLGYLDYQRATLRWKTAGVASEGLRRTVAESSLTLGGLLKHMSWVEDYWFGYWLLDREPATPWRDVNWESDPDWEFTSALEDGPENLRAMWETSVARSRARVAHAISQGGLDRLSARSAPDGERPSLRWIIVHMIEEYARHNGHADLIREAVDGLTGE